MFLELLRRSCLQWSRTKTQRTASLFDFGTISPSSCLLSVSAHVFRMVWNYRCVPSDTNLEFSWNAAEIARIGAEILVSYCRTCGLHFGENWERLVPVMQLLSQISTKKVVNSSFYFLKCSRTSMILFEALNSEPRALPAVILISISRTSFDRKETVTSERRRESFRRILDSVPEGKTCRLLDWSEPIHTF